MLTTNVTGKQTGPNLTIQLTLIQISDGHRSPRNKVTPNPNLPRGNNNSIKKENSKLLQKDWMYNVLTAHHIIDLPAKK